MGERIPLGQQIQIGSRSVASAEKKHTNLCDMKKIASLSVTFTCTYLLKMVQIICLYNFSVVLLRVLQGFFS